MEMQSVQFININTGEQMKNHKKAVFILTIALSILVAAVIFLWVRYGQRAERYQCTNSAMGTNIEQTVYGRNAQKAATAAAQNIGELDSLISWQNDGSDTDRLNQAAGTDWVSIDAKTAKLLQTCLGVASDSGGAFDPTILPIASLWDFGGDNQHVPSETDIQKYLPYVGYKNLRVNTAKTPQACATTSWGWILTRLKRAQPAMKRSLPTELPEQTAASWQPVRALAPTAKRQTVPCGALPCAILLPHQTVWLPWVKSA